MAVLHTVREHLVNESLLVVPDEVQFHIVEFHAANGVKERLPILHRVSGILPLKPGLLV